MKSQLILIVFFIISCIIPPSHGTAEMYKWVDENGTIHFQDYKPSSLKPSIPVETFTEEQLKLDNYVEGSNGDSYESPYASAILNEAKKPSTKKTYNKDQKVELYVTSWCGYCKKAKSFLKAKGVEFTEYDIEKDKNAAKRHRKLNRRGGVPVAVINGKKIIGFSKAAYESALKKR